MQKLISITVLLLLGFSFFSCQKNSSSSELPPLEVSEEFLEQAALGAQTFDILSTGNKIGDLTGNSELEYEVPDFPGLYASIQEYRSLYAEIKTKISSTGRLTKPTEDSLYYCWDDTTNGVKTAIYYDSVTDTARLYIVKYKFLPINWLSYDSTEFKIKLSHTIENSSDDILISIYNKKEYKEGLTFCRKEREISRILITDYAEQEITGAELTNDVYFRNRPKKHVTHIHRFIDADPSQTITLSETFYFDNGASFSRSVTFNPDNTGTFSKTFQNGLTVAGTFDSLEDDGEGSFTETITFPESNEILDQIYKSASLSVFGDSVFNGEFEKFIYFDSGKIDSFYISIHSVNENDVTTTTLTGSKPNGAHGIYTIVEDSSGITMEGTWTFWNDYYAEIEATYYTDGSADIYYSVYNPQEELVLTAEYHISPDGSGEGAITQNGETYTFTFNGDGKADITKGEQKLLGADFF